jgi:sensory rhodopsin
MNIQIETVFAIGVSVFVASSIYFLLAYKKEFNTAFLVSFITVISYTLMLEGSFASVGAVGGEVHVSRWLFYALSCTLLMYEIAKFLKKSVSETVFLLYLTVIVMATGAAAAYFEGWFMIGMFVISSVAYVLMVYPILTSSSPHRAAVAKYILLGWTGFPVAFLLAPDGFGVITAATAAILFLLLDVFTKVFFYFDLHPKMKAESLR